jgi:hypothetical protein
MADSNKKPRGKYDHLTDDEVVRRLIDATARWAPGASGICFDPMSETFRQNLVAMKDEVLRRLRLAHGSAVPK